jgi:hypothetical protein
VSSDPEPKKHRADGSYSGNPQEVPDMSVKDVLEAADVGRAGLVALGWAAGLGLVVGIAVITFGARALRTPDQVDSLIPRVTNLETGQVTLRGELEAHLRDGDGIAELRIAVDSLQVLVTKLFCRGELLAECQTTLSPR